MHGTLRAMPSDSKDVLAERSWEMPTENHRLDSRKLFAALVGGNGCPWGWFDGLKVDSFTDMIRHSV
jgi:hypothetical protein